MALFALSQSFTGAGMQFAYGLVPLMVIGLTGSASLAGLSVSLIGFSRFLVSYPIGKITDTYGRKPGILLGLVLALMGSVLLGLSLTFRSPVLFILGMLVFAMGMYGAQQLRVAATDMFLPHMRAQASAISLPARWLDWSSALSWSTAPNTSHTASAWIH